MTPLEHVGKRGLRLWRELTARHFLEHMFDYATPVRQN
jgi:hypothetical protein